MAWNYRVLQTGHGLDATWAIHEVHYHDDGRPRAATVNPAYVCGGDSLEALEWVLDQMQMALKKPVLTDEDFVPSPHLVADDYRPEIG
jgi:hypothetical protein